MRRFSPIQFAIVLLLIPFGFLHSQQECDEDFDIQWPTQVERIKSETPVFIDEAHHNFHTMNGRYCGFTKLLNKAGLKVAASRQEFSEAHLRDKKVMVISNAADPETGKLHEGNDPWVLPNRSAFSSEEIANVKEWVNRGGRLLLIADHMPFPGCADELAKAFGFSFFNGYSVIKDRSKSPSRFKKEDGTLSQHEVTAQIDSVATFTGSGFWCPEQAIQLMVFAADHEMIMVQQSAPPIDPEAPRFSAEGLCQGALLSYGEGKVAVFGEAAMFTTQKINGNRRFGFNHNKAPQNVHFIVNLMRWLIT